MGSSVHNPRKESLMIKPQWDIFRLYRKGDLRSIWGDLRAEDRQELETGGIINPDVVEEAMLPLTSKLLTWDTEVGPVAVLGVTRLDNPHAGLVWAIASNKAKPRWRFAVRNTEDLLREMGQGYHVLSNYKDARNTQQINWLKKLGFVFINTVDVDGQAFHEFVRIVK
jgi:hypothetical protein